ncbi:MAG: hypothetical protein AAF192_22800 [Pseudomonadota bacterium]
MRILVALLLAAAIAGAPAVSAAQTGGAAAPTEAPEAGPDAAAAAGGEDDAEMRQALAAQLYDLYLKEELTRQTVAGTLPAVRDQFVKLAEREGREIDEGMYNAFVEALSEEIAEDMDRLSARMVALLSRDLSLEEMRVMERLYADPSVRETLAKLPPIFNRFAPAVVRERNVTLRRVMVDYPPETMLR